MTQQNTLPLNKWKPYPAYKDSGVVWLGEIPAKWEVKRLKNITQINPEVLPEAADPDYVIQYIDITNVNANGAIVDVQELRFEDAPSRARRIVRHGDTIISTVRTYLKAISFINNPPENLLVSTGFAVLRAIERVKPKFLWRLVQSQQFVDSVVSHSEGVSYPAISPSRLACLPILLPPIEEQAAITGFIDQETAKIDALIAKKERQIELLQEKRAALINRAVTQGLDPAVPIKDSGIEWLGKIPAHWELKRLKNITEINSEVLHEKTDADFLLQYVDISNVDSNGSIVGLQKLCFEDAPSRARRIVRHGDTIVSTVRTYLKAIAYIFDPPEDLIVSTGFAVLRPKKEVIPGFLWRLLQSQHFVDSVVSCSEGVSYPAINPSRLGGLPVWLPPPNEQKIIVAFLEQETAKIDALITKIREGIEKLKEYRTALISAAVTGKIDVRGQTSGQGAKCAEP